MARGVGTRIKQQVKNLVEDFQVKFLIVLAMVSTRIPGPSFLGLLVHMESDG